MPWNVEYDPTSETLSSRVTGILSMTDVTEWRDALYRGVARRPAGTVFRALTDIRGYEVADQDRSVHAEMRQVIPVFLAEHGFAVGFWRLYEADPPAPASSIRCRAVAHVHHDQEKADRYNELLATATERFFTDRAAAQEWLTAA